MIKLKKQLKKMEFMNSVSVMNSRHFLIKLSISVCIPRHRMRKIILANFVIDWRVDGDPEHEINGANPRVAEGALTMVC